MAVETLKPRREDVILSLIARQDIGTQTELVQALEKEGFEVTQATISREVRRLGLIKEPLPGGGYRYSAPSRRGAPAHSLRGLVAGMSQAEAFLVLHTLPGRAMAVAVSIDELEMDEVSGTLAGDDTVLVLIEKFEMKEKVSARLAELI